MLKEFQTITLDGVEASVVHVHNEHAFEIEYHDERHNRVVTLDLDPHRTERKMLPPHRPRVLMPPCPGCGRKMGETIVVGTGALSCVCETCVDALAATLADARRVRNTDSI